MRQLQGRSSVLPYDHPPPDCVAHPWVAEACLVAGGCIHLPDGIGERERERRTIRGHNGGGRRSVRPSVRLSLSQWGQYGAEQEGRQCVDFEIM